MHATRLAKPAGLFYLLCSGVQPPGIFHLFLGMAITVLQVEWMWCVDWLQGKKRRLCQRGYPCLCELSKRFSPGASNMQTPTIKLGIGFCNNLCSFFLLFCLQLVFMSHAESKSVQSLLLVVALAVYHHNTRTWLQWSVHVGVRRVYPSCWITSIKPECYFDGHSTPTVNGYNCSPTDIRVHESGTALLWCKTFGIE